MPEGDAIHRAARRLQVLVGQELEVETPHPRAAVKQLAPRLDGRRLESVEAIGKNLLLRFEGGIVLRSHLRMKGRWRVSRRDTPLYGVPWLVLRGKEHVGAMFNGAELPFAFEEHSSYDRPALYEYRPLVKTFVEERAHTLRRRPDAQLAVEELRREPAATIFARAHAGPRADEHEALFTSVLLPLLVQTAEACGGF